MDVCGAYLGVNHAITYAHDIFLWYLLLFGIKNDYQRGFPLTVAGVGNSFLFSFRWKGSKDMVPGYKRQVQYTGFTLLCLD